MGDVLRVGDILHDRYKIVRILGKGGQGAVYKTLDKDLFNQPKAIKESFNGEEYGEGLFLKEAKILTKLDHPGLSRISDFFKDKGKYYIVMDFVEGRDLEEILKKNPKSLTESKIIRIAIKLCDILNYMHHQKPKPIVFRDMKPANIILTPEKEVKLIDFGIARFYDKNKPKDTINIGTAGYAAPEQYGGQTDPRTDIYAFGMMLHHLLTGNDPRDGRPFDAGRIPVRKLNPSVSPDMERIISRMVKYKREERYQTILQVKKDLLKLTTSKPHPAELVYQDTKAKSFVIDKDIITIGRGGTNDFILKDEKVSREHAIIKKKGRNFIIVDLGSTNGTYVNNRRVKTNLLKNGFTIRLGDTFFVFKAKGKGENAKV